MAFEQAGYSLRMLARHKRFSALAIISLGAAIALNTTMYSVLDTMIAPKLAMREPHRLYEFVFYGDFRRKIPETEKNRAYESLPFAEGLTGVTGAGFAGRYVQRGNELREARTITVLPNYFQVLGVRPSAGRLLSAVDLTTQGRPVVLSERMWKQLFADKQSFEAATISVGGELRMVVGLLPFEADFPGNFTDVWQLPLPADVDKIVPSLVRVRPDVTPEHAKAELEVLRLRFAETTGERDTTRVGFRFFSATQRPFKPWGFHFALIGSVLAVLLIACANLANLQLARGVSRARELATRAAVGATRRDIVVQLMTESAWLALGGLILGSVLTAWGMKVVDAYVPPSIAEYMTHPQMSWRVLVFAVGVTVLCLTLMGLAPAIRVSRVDVNELLKSGAGTGRNKSTRRQYGALVVVEVALALALLCSASLLMRAALSVITYDPGYDTRGLLTTFVALAAKPGATRTRQDWSDALVQRALAVPGIANAAVNRSTAPRTHSIATEDAGGSTAEHQLPKFWSYQVVTPDFLRTMRMPITKGRDFTVGEFAEPSIIVDERSAAFLWPGADPIGRLVKLDSARTAGPWLRVVGVTRRRKEWFRVSLFDADVASARELGDIYVLSARDTATVTAPVSGRSRFTTVFSLGVRTSGDPVHVGIALQQALRDAGAGYVGFPQTWEQSTGIARLKDRHGFIASLFTLFGALALALAALGVYAIIAHMVAQRTREFGVRIAVGASVSDIRKLVLHEGNVLALAGIAIGLLLTAYGAGWLRAFLFDDYDRYDSRVYAVASLSLFAVAWLASYIPARRAMRINPVEALRND